MLIVFEGIDGAGKNTQTGLLTQKVACEGLSSAVFSFPRYGLNPFARAIPRYLNGEFGGLEQVAPELAALLYAGDRFATHDELVDACATHDVVICDRYVPSNLAHQAAKLPAQKRDAFIDWILDIEHNTYKMPKPDLIFYLDMPVEVSQRLIMERGKRAYTDEQADIHERAQDYLAQCRDIFLQLSEKKVCGRWARVLCVDANNKIRAAEDISQDIWSLVHPFLLQQPSC